MRLGLIDARMARGWSQQEVAAILGKDRSAISKYETGDCDIPGEVLRQLATLLAVPMDILHANHEAAPATLSVEGE